jgi:hypothetical protein
MALKIETGMTIGGTASLVSTLRPDGGGGIALGPFVDFQLADDKGTVQLQWSQNALTSLGDGI